MIDYLTTLPYVDSERIAPWASARAQANHMSLYDVPQYVSEAVSTLAPFFKANL